MSILMHSQKEGSRMSDAMAREALDRRREAIDVQTLAPPVGGWLQSIRSALGLSAAALAVRIGVTQSTVLALEESERKGGARLGTLRRAAEALDCDLVYALVPRTSLEETVRRRALEVADDELGWVAHSMDLEAQATPVTDDLRERLADQIIASGRVWRS